MSEKNWADAYGEAWMWAAEGEAEFGRAIGTLLAKWSKNIIAWLSHGSLKKA